MKVMQPLVAALPEELAVGGAAPYVRWSSRSCSSASLPHWWVQW